MTSSKPRILFLTPGCFDKGGISRYSRYQIEAWRSIVGHERVSVMSLLGPDANSFETPFDVDWSGGETVSALTRAQLVARAIGICALKRPDLVHIAHVNFAPFARTLGRLSGAKTLLNVYGLEIWSGLKPARAEAMRHLDHVLADCHATADYTLEAHLRQHRPTVIWDCVDLDRFTPGRPDPAALARYGVPDPDRHLNVVTLGRLAHAAAHKGYDRLIKAFAAAARDRTDMRLVIAGRGDMRTALEALAKDEGIADKTTFTGPVDDADIPHIYRAAGVFSLVSDRGEGRGEGIPLTPLEAMACGAPVVVGDEDGSREAVVDGRNGLVVSPRNPQAQIAALLELGRPERRAELSREARKVAEENFSYTSFRDKHAALLATILS